MPNPPVPTALRKLRGNPGKRRLNHEEPVLPRLVSVPPPELTGEALEEWQRLAPMLAQSGVLTEADVRQLSLYCVEVQTWKEAHRRCLEFGLVVKTPGKVVVAADGTRTETGAYMVQSPYLPIRNRAVDLMVRLAGTLGLEPACRTRLKAEVRPAKATARDSAQEWEAKYGRGG